MKQELTNTKWLAKELKTKTATQIADEYGFSVGSVKYHIRFLTDEQKEAIKSRTPWDKDIKNIVRTMVCTGNPDKIYKNILLLPSHDCLDLQELLKRGAINRDTNIWAIERDPDVVHHIKKKVNKLGLDNITIVNKEVHDFKPNVKFDYIYLDTCGQLNAQVMNWLCQIYQDQNLTNDCDVFLAFSAYRRLGIAFFNDLSESFKATNYKPDFTFYKHTEETRLQHNVMANVLSCICGDIVKSWVYKNDAQAVPMNVFQFKGFPANVYTLYKVLAFLSRKTDVDFYVRPFKTVEDRVKEISQQIEKLQKELFELCC